MLVCLIFKTLWYRISIPKSYSCSNTFTGVILFHISIGCINNTDSVKNDVLHWCIGMAKDDTHSITKFWIHNSDVSQSNVLINEVLRCVALCSQILQLRPAQAAWVCSAQDAAIRLLGRSNPDSKLLRGLHVDIFIQDISNSSPLLFIPSSELHVNSFRCVVHEAVTVGDVVDNAVTNGPNSESYSTGLYSLKQHVLAITLEDKYLR